MKTKLLLLTAFAGLLSFLQACAMMTPSQTTGLTGSWTNQLGTVWTLNGDRTFDVDINHDGKRDAWGTYAVNGDTITITGTGGEGPSPKGCNHTTGTYHFVHQGNTLHFTLVKDPCKLRVKNVLKPWHKS
jgi:hypothetical protein